MIAGYLLICYSFWTMKRKIWIILVTYIAYCINRELYKAIEYLKVQVEVLIEQQEKQNKRILLTNHQRIRVAAKAMRLSRKMLEQCTVLFMPDTVMRWYNKLIAEKYDGSSNRGKIGRPAMTDERGSRGAMSRDDDILMDELNFESFRETLLSEKVKSRLNF